jgi:dephospho-CoA kinase
MSRIIGLTGGIATGKTTVSRYLAEKYHLPILDADLYAREAVAINSPILQAIYQRYGDAVKLPDGNLNRQVLGKIIFTQPQEKEWLESQIHPYVRTKFVSALATLNHPLIVLVIPLLFEANMTDLVNEIWVVTSPETTQIERIQTRDGLTKSQAIARINNQLPLQTKIAKADFILDNTGNLPDLYQQIDAKLIDYNL